MAKSLEAFLKAAGGRKTFITLISLLVAAIGLFTGHLAPGDWVNVTTVLVGAFTVGNVGEHFAAARKNE